MAFSRRHFLLTGGLLGGGAYINKRGLRFPRLGFEPRPLVFEKDTQQGRIALHNCSFISQGEDNLRAFAPNPKIVVDTHSSSLELQISNIAPAAQLTINANSGVGVQEEITGIKRKVKIDNAAGDSTQSISLSWHLPNHEQVRFAVIGDTGGGTELGWCIERAHQLQATFLLHLGDFNYSAGEYDSAIEKFNNAPLPIYISIGNHDFNDSGLVYQKFRQQLGPMNNSFIVANTRFVNIDSGANFFPPYSGHRGALIDQLRSTNTEFSDQLFFTHKPFIDTREGHHHNISGLGEIDWVQQAMHELGVRHFLCGHVHRSSAIEVNGIQQWTAGEGLGFEDIRHQKQTAQILIGEASASKELSLAWHPLEMPWSDHTSPTHIQKLKKQGLNAQLDWYLSKLRQAQT